MVCGEIIRFCRRTTSAALAAMYETEYSRHANTKFVGIVENFELNELPIKHETQKHLY